MEKWKLSFNSNLWLQLGKNVCEVLNCTCLMYDSVNAAEEDYLKKLDDNVTRIGLIFNTTASYTLRFANDTVPMDIVSDNPCEFIVFVKMHSKD